MSVRRTSLEFNPDAQRMQDELSKLKALATAASANDRVEAANTQTTPSAAFDQLSATEKSAASLGVHPDSWRPIGFMNNKHHEQLLKSNSLDDDLARRIEVCV